MLYVKGTRIMMLQLSGLYFRASEFKVWGWLWALGFRATLGLGVWDVGFRMQGSGFRALA